MCVCVCVCVCWLQGGGLFDDVYTPLMSLLTSRGIGGSRGMSLAAAIRVIDDEEIERLELPESTMLELREAMTAVRHRLGLNVSTPKPHDDRDSLRVFVEKASRLLQLLDRPLVDFVRSECTAALSSLAVSIDGYSGDGGSGAAAPPLDWRDHGHPFQVM